MKQKTIALACVLASPIAMADNVADADKLLCSASQVQICFETGECFPSLPWALGIPQFLIVDTNKKLMSTTRASGENRTSPIANLIREDGRIVVQGFEQGRAFSMIIEEDIGAYTASVATDGTSINVFGSCTDTDGI